jgi:uncharacterized alkaline shock family protein YloU
VAGHSSISPDVLARYAGDAAREVIGVHGLAGNALLRHDGVKISRDGETVGVELHLVLEWGAGAPAVGAEVQERVAETLARMAGVQPETVDVVVDEFAPPTA